MSKVLFSIWFSIQGIIQNTTCSIWLTENATCSIWFRIQRIIKKCPGYYSVSGSGFRVLFKMVQYSGYYSKYDLQRLVQDSAYYSKKSWVLFSVWFSIQGIIQNATCSVWFRIQHINQKWPGYYSASGSVFRVLFKMRPAASGSGFSILIKNGQGIIQRLVQYSDYYSKYDQQRLVPDSAYYSLWFRIQGISKMSRVLFSVWFGIQGFIQNATSSVWFSIRRIIKNVHGIIQRMVQYSAYY